MRGTSALRVWKRMMSSSVKETTAEGFRQAWLERAPQTQEPPLTPSDYMSSLGKASEETQKEQGKLSFSFMLPHSTLTQDEEVRKSWF